MAQTLGNTLLFHVTSLKYVSTRPLRNLHIPDYDSRQPSDILTLIYLFG